MSTYEYDEELRLDEATEEVPLLQRRPTAVSRFSHISIHQAHSVRIVLILLYIAFFIIEIGSVFLTIPSVRIFEDIICHHYYDRDQAGMESDIPEEFCKGKEVQQELAVIAAGSEMANVIPCMCFRPPPSCAQLTTSALILALPYGILADRIGRKPVVFLSLLGILLAVSWSITVAWFWKVFPLRLVWLGAIFRVIGGGDAVVASTVYAIMTDSVAQDNR